MKTDACTKFLLAVIAVLLGVLVFGRTSPSSANAESQPAAGPFSDVRLVSAGSHDFTLFDARTGQVTAYALQSNSEKGWQFHRMSRPGIIAEPGAEVRNP